MQDLTRLYNINCDSVAWFLSNEFRNIGRIDENHLYSAAYVIVKHSQTNNSDFSTLESFLSTNILADNIRNFIRENLNGSWNVVIGVKDKFPVETYKAFLLFYNLLYLKKSDNDTPNCISTLSAKILNIQAEDTVADFCCGNGSFIYNAVVNYPYANYYGLEISYTQKCIADMRADILGININFELKDVLTIEPKYKFDKIFSAPPLAIKTFNVSNDDNKPLVYLKTNIPNLSKKISSDLIFAASIINNLKNDGKAVIVVTPNSTYNLPDIETRKYFVENGFIESVIALPANLLESTSIPVVLIVLSFGNNEISFIDALNIFTAGRRKNTLSEENINTILTSLKSETPISKKISSQEVADNNYDLYPPRYYTNFPDIKDGIKFETVIKSIVRGAQIKANELDKLVSYKYTGMHYIMLNDIQDGIVNSFLPNITEIESKYEKHCIYSCDAAFILSKNGPVFKAAYITATPKEKFLINGNMYIIHLDTSKINPIFLKAFIESEKGQTQLKNICSGSQLLTLSPDSLKKMIIPLPDMQIQNRVAERYSEKLNEVIKLKKQLENANNELLKIYDDYVN